MQGKIGSSLDYINLVLGPHLMGLSMVVSARLDKGRVQG